MSTKNDTQIHLRTDTKTKASIQAEAEKMGIPMTSYILIAVYEKMKRDNE